MKTNNITKKHALRIFRQQCIPSVVRKMMNKKRPILNALCEFSIDIPIEYKDYLTQYSAEVIAHLKNEFKKYGLSMAILETADDDSLNIFITVTIKALIERIETRVLIC